MHQGLQDNHYLVLPDFLPHADRQALENVFQTLVKSAPPPSDEQVANAPAVYNFPPFLELLCMNTGVFSQVLGAPLLPTYCYARAYRQGNVLPRHKDRGACEVSLTLNLGADARWPIFIQKPNGEEVAVDLAPGDAMMYLGMDADHWRGPFQGTTCTQVFLHYVRSRGPYRHLYFDRKPES